MKQWTADFATLKFEKNPSKLEISLRPAKNLSERASVEWFIKMYACYDLLETFQENPNVFSVGDELKVF